LKRTDLAILSIIVCVSILSVSRQKIKPEISIVNAERLTSFSTIQEAINTVNLGGTVYVPSGVYYENVVLNKSVTLVGESRGNTIIDGAGRGGVLVQVTANNTSISGFTIRNGTVGVSIVNGHFENISGNAIESNFQGVSLEDSDNNLVIENNLTNNDNAITIRQSNDNIILANSLKDNYSPGISIYYSHNNTVSRNLVENNPAYGIYLENCQNNTISENSVTLVCNGIQLQSSQNNTISGNTVTKTGPYAVDLEDSYENTVEKNVLEQNELTFQLFNSSNNVVTQNNLTMNWYGLFLIKSGSNTLEGNRMTNNSISFGVFGEQPTDFINKVSVSNTVDGRPVYYWVDRHGSEVPSDAGFVALINSTNISVANVKLASNYEGILLAYSEHIILRNLTVRNSLIGVWLLNSSNNIMTECTLQGNTQSLWFKQSNNNTIYWNNFSMSPNPSDVSGTANKWDNGYPDGGNYWAAFVGTDEFNGPYQNTTGSDGISDLGYAMNPGNKDRFPLMSPIEVLDAGVWDGQRYRAYVISNCTVSDFLFDPSGTAISFNLTGQEATNSFCRVIVPKQLLWADDERWTILLGGERMNYSRTSNEGYTYLYFTFTASLGSVKVMGTQSIPEFESPAVVSFLILVLTLAGVLAMKTLRVIVRPPKLK
jgi:parallel beta-helix repeat protein